MITPRSLYAATLLTGGKVLFAGGGQSADRSILAGTELYDPSSGTFTATGDMVNAGVNGTAILLANGYEAQIASSRQHFEHHPAVRQVCHDEIDSKTLEASLIYLSALGVGMKIGKA